MNRVAHRTTIALILALVLIIGMVIFGVEYVMDSDEWAVFSGNPHVYSGSNIGTGVITDRSGVTLLDATSGRVYSDDYTTRLSTLHWLGDRAGSISAPAVSYYSSEMVGYNFVTGLYSYSGDSGSATLTLSAEVQNVALNALGNQKGTVAVYNYETGEILCAVSTPAYDPDNVPDIEGDTTGAYEGVYLNRFTQVSYTPGSIFKVITAAAALETDANNQYLEFTCNGSYSFGADSVTCEKVHGTISMKTALAKSCNCYFAQLVEHIGGDTLEKYVEQLQVTESVTFDGITTQSGNFNLDGAAAVEIAWSGIGQYVDQVNPCRFMTVMGAIAGGGEAAAPYVVKEVSSGSGVSYKAKTQTTGKLLSSQTTQILTEMMRNNVTTIYGDGYFPGLNVCAKSGTAQVGGDQKPNATFAGFVADEEYPLAFVAVVENAGYGSDVCVPIMSKVLTACKDLMDQE